MRLFEKINNYCEFPFKREGDVVYDANTGLYWEYKTDSEEAVNSGLKRYTFDGARDVHIAQLNEASFGGYSDWRVPNKDELRSIFDYGREESVIDDIFGCCPVGDYWTKNIYKLQPYFSWVLFSGFGSGIAKRVSAENYVIAVRGGKDKRFGEPDESRFKDNGDGTVTDETTGLMWQKDTNKRMGPRDAEEYIASMDLAGYSDWRLPNIKELNTILNLDESKDDWFFDPFPVPENEKMLHYAACDLFERHYAWVTNFTFGYDGYYGGRTAPLLSRAVRYAETPKPDAPKADAPKADADTSTFVITHTGQERAFDLKGREVDKNRIWGLDAQRIWDKPSFELIEGGKAVKDDVNGLIWDNDNDDKVFTWKDAKEYIAGLNDASYLGRNDWRLPGREEIRTLVKYDDSQPATYTEYFKNTGNTYYWTAYTDKANNENAWGIYMGYGCTYTAPKEKKAHIKAVAGGRDPFLMPSTERFVKNGDGTITDKVTGLMWMEEETPLLTQREALVYCRELTLAGYNDWVMPTLKELATLINLTEGDEWYYRDLFPNTNTKPQGFYQSSTVYGGTFGWGVNFQFGFDGYYADRMSGKYPFRPVRRV